MSILETFFVLFDTNAKKAAADVGTLENKVDDAAGSLDEGSDAADKLGARLKELASGAAIAGAAVATIAAGIGIAIERAGEIKQMDQTAKALGVNIPTLDAFGRAAVAAGGDAQGAFDSLTDIAEAAGEAIQDVESQRAKTFAGLKISLKDAGGAAKDAVTNMLDLAGAVEGMSRAEAIFRIKELGVTDNRSVELLLKGRRALQEMIDTQKAGGVVTERQAKIAVEYSASVATLTNRFDSIKNSIAENVLPWLGYFYDKAAVTIDYLTTHKDVVVGFFAAVATVATVAYAPAMWAAARATWGVVAGAYALVAPFLIAAATVAAIGVAFALVYEDIQAFREGNDSLIGQLASKYEWFGSIVQALGAFFTGVAHRMRQVATIGGNAFTVLRAVVTEMWDAVSAKVTDFLGRFPLVEAAVRAVGAVFRSVFGWLRDTLGWISDKLGSALDQAVTVSNAVAGGVRRGMAPTQALGAAQGALGAAAGTRLAAQTSQGIVARGRPNVSRSTVVGPVTVHTRATDAAGTGRAVQRAIGHQMRSAVDNHDDGIDR